MHPKEQSTATNMNEPQLCPAAEMPFHKHTTESNKRDTVNNTV